MTQKLHPIDRMNIIIAAACIAVTSLLFAAGCHREHIPTTDEDIAAMVKNQHPTWTAEEIEDYIFLTY
ncbi:hypothetical protein GCM10027051_31360 [Niabella terrae]